MRTALTLVLIASILSTGAALGSMEALRSVPASDIQYLLISGKPVQYNNVIIKGDLHLDQLGLPVRHINRTENEIKIGFPENLTLVSSSIRINDSIIEGLSNLSNALFLAEVDFSRTRFNCDADFGFSRFNSNVNFWYARFDNNSNFEVSQFNGSADFRHVQFYNSANFMNSQFNNIVTFRESLFNRTANFWSSKFNSNVNFIDSRFNSYVSFENSRFNKSANLRNSQFRSDADFKGSYFGSTADFTESHFNSTVDIRESRFNGYSNFENSRFNSYANFKNTQFRNGADFKGSYFDSTADFTESKFDGVLDFTGIIYKNIFFNWFSIKNPYKFSSDRTVYLSLIKYFKDIGDFNSADDCFYHYRIWVLLSENQSWTMRLMDFMILISCGYCVKPLNTIILGFILIILFGLIYWWNEILRKQGLKSISYRDAIFFSAAIFLTLHHTQGWSYSERWRYLIIFEHILGLILMTLFVITMTNVVLK
jgi:hypothetical protein